MITTALLGHGDGSGAGATHMSWGSIWMMLSMVAFSLFLLASAWALLRPPKSCTRTAADVAAERFARDEIGAEDFERVLRVIRSNPR